MVDVMRGYLKMNELVSIIIPVYNTAVYLKKCLDSVIKQTYTQLEILLIDDGSTDESGKICDIYASKDKRIRVIHKKNSGQADSRNIGIELSKGEYIAFLDSDDFVSEEYIEYLYILMKYMNADVANCEFKRVWKSGEGLENRGDDIKEKRLVFTSESAIENLCYLKELNCAPIGKLYKREVWNNIKFPVGYIYEDLAVIYKVFSQANIIVYGSKQKYFYFQRPDSSLHTIFNVKKLSRIQFSDEIESFVMEQYPEIYKAAVCRKFWSNAGALMDLPWSFKYGQYLKIIKKNIYTCRRIVLFDRKAKKSIRFMAAMSYLGVISLKILGSIYKKIYKG